MYIRVINSNKRGISSFFHVSSLPRPRPLALIELYGKKNLGIYL